MFEGWSSPGVTSSRPQSTDVDLDLSSAWDHQLLQVELQEEKSFTKPVSQPVTRWTGHASSMCSLRLRPPGSTGSLEGPGRSWKVLEGSGGFWRVLEGAGLCLLPPTCPDVHNSCTPRAVDSAWLCCLADVDKTSWANWSKQES